MSYVDAIIERFGGRDRMAFLVGCKSARIRGWQQRGEIPPARQREVLAAARQAGIRLDPADFFREHVPAPPPRSQRVADDQ